MGVDDVTLSAAAANRLGLADAAGVTPPPRLADARRLINLLADCRPPSDPLTDDAVARLEARLARLLAAAQELAADLVAAADANPESALAGALGSRALRWGLAGPAGAASARMAQHLAGFAPGGDPIADLRALATLGPVGETARRQVPVLAPLAPPETGPEIEPAWRDVFGRVRPSLGSVPATWRWRRHPDETEWTGRPDESGKARASDVVLRPADQAGRDGRRHPRLLGRDHPGPRDPGHRCVLVPYAGRTGPAGDPARRTDQGGRGDRQRDRA